jgi:hypothetical protein
MSKSRTIQTAIGWAWMLEDGSLCRWAEPNAEQLRRADRPSPGAKRVCVRMIKESEWRRLVGKRRTA